MGLLLSLAASAVSGLLRGAGARRDERRMRAAEKRSYGYKLGKLRAEAERYGFNPLTVLQETGAANYARRPLPVVQSGSIAADAFDAGYADFTASAALDREFKESVRQFEVMNSKLAGPSVPGTFASGPTSQQTQADPWSRVQRDDWMGVAPPQYGTPAYAQWAMTKVPVLTDTGFKEVRQAYLYERGWQPWSYITPQEYTDLMGDVAGEAAALTDQAQLLTFGGSMEGDPVRYGYHTLSTPPFVQPRRPGQNRSGGSTAFPPPPGGPQTPWLFSWW